MFPFRLLSSLLISSLVMYAPLSAQTASTYAVTLTYSAGQQAPAPQSVSIANAAGTVTARISRNINASANAVTDSKDNAGVFAYSVMPGGDANTSVIIGTNPSNTNILASLAAKGWSTYTGTLLVSATDCSDCISIALYLQIGPSSQVNVQWNGAPATAGLNLNAAAGAYAQTSLLLTTFSPATFTATSNQAWLTVSPASGITGAGSPGQTVIMLTAYAATLPAGSNYATLNIATSLGSVAVPVTFLVGAPSGLVLSPGAMSFQYVWSTQSYPSGQSYPLTVTGTTVGSAFTASSNSGWLMVNNGSSTTGVVGSSITVSVNAFALGTPPSAATYTGYVYVNANGLSGTLTVTLAITGTYPSPGTMTFYAPVTGGSAALQYVPISGSGAYYTSVTRNNGATNWLSVSPASGVLTGSMILGVSVNSWGLAAGTYSGVIQVYVNTYYTQTINVLMYVGTGQAAGWLVAAPASITFSLPPGGSQSQTIVLNGGGNYFAAQASGQGISVNPASGTTPALLTVSVDATGLSPGLTAGGSVTIQSGANSQAVPVSINVQMGTILQTSPASLAMIWQGGTPAATSIQVSGSNDVTGSTQSISISAPSFVTLSAASGATPMTFVASLNTGALAAGFNTGNIVIMSSGAVNSPLYVPVTILAFAPPISPGITPSSLSLTAVSGGAAITNSVWVSSVGSGFFTAWANTAWLSVLPASGVSPAVLSVTANPAGLTAGTYYGTVTVAGYSGAVATVNVSLTVTPRAVITPILSVSVNKLSFTYQQGDPAPSAQTLQVNASAAPANFSVSTGAAWINASPASGSTPATLSITVNPSGLAVGTQTGSLTVTAPGTVNSPQTITVTVDITARPALTMSGNTVKFACTRGETDPETQTVRLSSTGPEMAFTVSNVSESWISVTPASGRTPATLTFTANAAGMSAGPHVATVNVATAYSTHTISVVITISVPLPTVTKVGNAASYQGDAIAPGEIIAISGVDMRPDTPASYSVSGGVISTSVSSTRVLISGYTAPILYVSATQITAIVPYAIAGRTTAFVEVEYEGTRSNCVTMPVTTTAPGVFTLNASGTGPGAILNQDGSVNTPFNPAEPGSIIVVYATGEGQTLPLGADGRMMTDLTSMPKPILPVSSTIAGVPADVLYAGAAPHAPAGMLQVNLRLPAGAGSGDVILTIGGRPSQSGVTVAIR